MLPIDHANNPLKRTRILKGDTTQQMNQSSENFYKAGNPKGFLKQRESYLETNVSPIQGKKNTFKICFVLKSFLKVKRKKV